jgi:membrane peptidoglycan carboxypeptidase
MTLRRALMRSLEHGDRPREPGRGRGECRFRRARQWHRQPAARRAVGALGSIEVTPLELVTAYAPFANGGSRVRPRLVRRIERMDGTLLWSSEPQLPWQWIRATRSR